MTLEVLLASFLIGLLGLVTWLVPDDRLIVPYAHPAFVAILVASPLAVAGIILALRRRRGSLLGATVAIGLVRRLLTGAAAVAAVYALPLVVLCVCMWKAAIPLPYLHLPGSVGATVVMLPAIALVWRWWMRRGWLLRILTVLVAFVLAIVAVLVGMVAAEIALFGDDSLPIGRSLHLVGRDLAGRDLTGARLERANLTFANLAGARLSQAKLRRANLFLATLTDADLESADLSFANLRGARAARANLSRATLTDTNLTSADVSRANFRGAIVGNVAIRGARHWIFASLDSLQLQSLGLPEDFSQRVATRSLSGMNLGAADLSGADLFGFDLSMANLRGADLRRTNLGRTLLAGADLSGANLSDARLPDANLALTTLTGSSLAGADLTDAVLIGATLDTASLIGTRVARADLRRTLMPCDQLTTAGDWQRAYRDEDLVCDRPSLEPPDLRQSILKLMPNPPPPSLLAAIETELATRQSTKPRVGVIVLGLLEVGARSLATALDKRSAERFGGTYRKEDEFSHMPAMRVGGVDLFCSRFETESTRHRYSNLLCIRESESARALAAKLGDVRGALVVVPATDPGEDPARELRVARAAGITRLVVYLDQADMLDADLLRLVEEEVQSTIREQGYAAGTPVIEGSSEKALSGDSGPAGVASIERLVRAMDWEFGTGRAQQ